MLAPLMVSGRVTCIMSDLHDKRLGFGLHGEVKESSPDRQMGAVLT